VRTIILPPSTRDPTSADSVSVGPTGCGKTAFLLALLGELHAVSFDGDYPRASLPRAGGVAYAAQEALLLSETIRQNIVFGSAFDESRYEKG
jgi:ABC-type transport system involved in cytochrome bd biosynthesis fused ATPase/permease subunit